MKYAAAAVFLVIFVLFLLSVFAPGSSEKPFWRFVQRARDVMDRISYGFLTICLVLSALAGLGYLLLRCLSAVMA